jgi:hypothetical protein
MKSLDLIVSNPEQALDPASAVFTQFIKDQTRLQNEIKEAWDGIEQAMRDNDITKIEGDWGKLSFVPKKTWIVGGKLPPRFYKVTLNTTKLNDMQKHGDKLPLGVTYKTDYHFRKDLH